MLTWNEYIRTLWKNLISFNWLSVEVTLKYLGLLATLTAIAGALLAADVFTKEARVTLTVSPPSIFIHLQAFRDYYQSQRKPYPKELGALIEKNYRFDSDTSHNFPNEHQQGFDEGFKDFTLRYLEEEITFDLSRKPSESITEELGFAVPYGKKVPSNFGRSIKETRHSYTALFLTKRKHELTDLPDPLNPRKTMTSVKTVPSTIWIHYPSATGYETIWKKEILPFIRKYLSIDDKIIALQAFKTTRRFASTINVTNSGQLVATNIKVFFGDLNPYPAVRGEIIDHRPLYPGPKASEINSQMTYEISSIKVGETKQILIWTSRIPLTDQDVTFSFETKREIDKGALNILFFQL